MMKYFINVAETFCFSHESIIYLTSVQKCIQNRVNSLNKKKTLKTLERKHEKIT